MDAWDGVTVVLDGATGTISAALLVDGALVGHGSAERSAVSGSGPAETIGGVVRALCTSSGVGPRIDRVVVGAGPGSFTGLRIAAAIGKGIAHGGRVPLLAVPSLALAAGVALADGLVRAGDSVTTVLDALRGEWYAQSFRVGEGELRDAGHVRLMAAAALDARWIGPGRPVVGGPHARGVVHCRALTAAVDAARWEPAYGRLAEAEVQRAARLASLSP